MPYLHLSTPNRLFGAQRVIRGSLLAAMILGLFLPAPARAELRFRAIQDRSAYLAPLSDTPVGLPPAWRFTPNVTMGALPDPTVTVTLDPATGLVQESYRQTVGPGSNIEIREPLVTSGEEYTSLLTTRTRKKLWGAKFKSTRSVARNSARPGGLFRVELPVQLPKAVRRIVGDGAPNLEVSGSETITIGGTSDWTVNRSNFTGERKRQGAFPSFEMKQELNVNLTGSIGDKIKVDVDQSSNVQTSLDNKVKLRYEGDDDDMIKLVELGNTNLSLQGASIRQEGLFGVKAAAKMGNVDVTTIASKQEGKNETARFTPSGEKTHVIILDQDYLRRQFFAITGHAVAEIRDLQVWHDPKSYTDVTTAARGMARLDPTVPYDSTSSDTLTNPQEHGNWLPLRVNVDYFLETDRWLERVPSGLQLPIIRLTSPIGDHEHLAVSYTEVLNGVETKVGYVKPDLDNQIDTVQKPAGEYLLKMLKPGPKGAFFSREDPATGMIDTSNPWYPVLKYELKNFYTLNATNITPASMTFRIRRVDQRQATDPDGPQTGNPYLQHLGLDQRTVDGEKAPDGKIDLQLVDAERGILYFPDLTPFDPAGNPPGSCSPDSFGLYCLNDSTRNLLRRGGSEELIANPLIYYRANPNRSTDSRYYIDAEFQSSRQGFFLGRFDILEGSEVVKVDGVPIKSGVDYTMDYMTGQLTFLRPPGPEQTITVDYSFAPGAGLAQRTLLGFSAGYNPAANLSFSTSALYESKGAQEDLVKLGEEPATSLVGDFSTLLSFKPVWMTQLTNRIPFIQTSQASGLNIQGSVATSIPEPNTKGEAYVDDMEGNKESNTLPLIRTQWMWSSIPAGMSSLLESHAQLRWYNPVDPLPTAVDEHDLKPTLTKEEGGEGQRQALELSVRPPAADSTFLQTTDWTGITLSLGSVPQDLSRVQFVEIWVNDFKSDHTLTRANLHLDFGRVSEDAYWDPRNPPNNRLDTEDRNLDGRLDRRDPEGDPVIYLAEDEDTGLDGVHDAQETGTGEDPHGDNYGYNANSAPGDFGRINNFENSAIDDPNARPDTEDLNRDSGFDTNNDYFEATLDLSRSDFVAIDVPRDYFGDPDVKASNGWRLFRIPVSAFQPPDTLQRPSWSSVQAVRIWLDGMTEPTTLQIGGIELIGNRWLEQPVLDPTRTDSLEVLTRNNKDDAGIYEPPYEVQANVGGTAARREQSLALKYMGLAAGDSVFAFKTTGDVGSASGWTLYQEVRFYVHGDAGVESQNLRAVARFGPDTVNYYEYSVPVKSGWQSVIVPMERLSSLKALRRSSNFYVDRDTGAPTGEVYAVFGNPSFTRVNRISFGLTVDGAPVVTPAFGEVWINELRLSDVRKDRGFSSNVSVQANFADLLSVNGSYNRTDEDFFRVGQGSTQGSGVDNTAVGFSSTLNLDRFLPSSGIQLPVRVSLAHSTDVPKFRTGSDVILDPSRSDVETRELNRRSIDLSYRRTSRSKGIARYTLDAITGGLQYSEQGSVNPASRDSSWSFHTNGSYTALIGGKGLKLGPLPLRVNPIPQTFTFTTDWVSTRNVSYARMLTDTSDTQELRSDLKQRLLGLNLLTSFEPLSGIRMKYSIQSTRDMLLHQTGYFGFNKGTEIRHTQAADLDYRPRLFGLFQPQITLSGSYNENASSEVRLSPNDPTNLKTITNQGTGRASFKIPVTRLAGKARGPNAGGGFLPIMPVRFVFSKFEDISVSGDTRRSAVLTRVTGDPGPAFKSGFTEVYDEELTRYPNSVFQTVRSYNATANTNFHPFDRLTFDIRGEYQLAFIDQVGGARRNLNYSWPSVVARWPDLQRILALNGTLSSLTLTSGLQRKVTEDGPDGKVYETRTQSTTFTPLVGWEAMFRSGVRLTATTNVDKTRTFDDRSIGFFRDRKALATALALNKNFPASKGIKFPWSKTRMKLKNDLNLGMNVNLSADETILYQRGNRLIEVERTSMQVGSSTNYNFSQTISGGFNLGYRTTTDKKNFITTRGITIAFTGSFRF